MEVLNELPCPILVTGASGTVLKLNAALLEQVGFDAAHWLGQPMERMFPPASRIFLQTHVWPMLLRDGIAREIRLQLLNPKGERTPILASTNRARHEGQDIYSWALFVSLERSRFEAELIEARNRAERASAALAKSEHFSRAVANALPSLVGYWDRNLRCVFANQAYLQMHNKSWDEIAAVRLPEVLGKELYALNLPHIEAVLRGDAQEFERDEVMWDGSHYQFLVSYIPDLDANGTVNGFFSMLTDVTRLKTAEAETRLAASVFEVTAEGIRITDSQGVIISVNPAFTHITGFSPAEALGNTSHSLMDGPKEDAFQVAAWRETAARDGRWEGEVWSRRKDASAYLQRQSITVMRDEAGSVSKYITVFNDVTERYEAEQLVKKMATHDSLTGLPNRGLLMERMGMALAIANREMRKLAVLFLDLDGFKSINDALGHESGDEVLRVVAARLQMRRRQTDTVARLGGDEFVVLLDNPGTQQELEQVVYRIIETVQQPIKVQNREISVGTSIGIAVLQNDGATAAVLLQRADTAMYAAKAAGKNTFRFASI